MHGGLCGRARADICSSPLLLPRAGVGGTRAGAGEKPVAPPLDASHDLLDRLARIWDASGQLSRLQARVDELQAANQDLQWQLRAAAAPIAAAEPLQAGVADEPLVQSSLMGASVLGRQARAIWRGGICLDVGTRIGASPEGAGARSVRTNPVTLDVGRDAGLARISTSWPTSTARHTCGANWWKSDSSRARCACQ